MVIIYVNRLCNAFIFGFNDNPLAIRGKAVQLVRKVLLKCQLFGHNIHNHINGCSNTGVYDENESQRHAFGYEFGFNYNNICLICFPFLLLLF